MSEKRGKQRSFAGIIQGLSTEKIHEIMFMKGFRSRRDYYLYKISLFKTIKNILPRDDSLHLEEKTDRELYEKISKGLNAEDFAGLQILEILEVFGPIGGLLWLS